MINKIQLLLLITSFMICIPASYSQLINNNITTSEKLTPSPLNSNEIDLKNNIVGTLNDDRIIGTPGTDVIIGLPGSDNIRGGNGTDVIQGDEDAN